MIKKYQVVWAEIAQHDLKQIIDYIGINSPGNASRVLQKIKQKYQHCIQCPLEDE
jgi:plasmid stabilization system protein ParE